MPRIPRTRQRRRMYMRGYEDGHKDGRQAAAPRGAGDPKSQRDINIRAANSSIVEMVRHLDAAQGARLHGAAGWEQRRWWNRRRVTREQTGLAIAEGIEAVACLMYAD